MHDFDIYSDLKEITDFQNLILKFGERIVLKKNEYFIRKGDHSSYLAFVKRGGFKCIGSNKSQSKKRILGFIFQNELISNYLPSRTNQASVLDMQAFENTVIYRIDMDLYPGFFEQKVNGTRYVRKIVELIAFQYMERCISLACQTAAERYNDLLVRVPDIYEHVYARDIASYLGISPETLSRMRTSMLYEKKPEPFVRQRQPAIAKEADLGLRPMALMSASI